MNTFTLALLICFIPLNINAKEEQICKPYESGNEKINAISIMEFENSLKFKIKELNKTDFGNYTYRYFINVGEKEINVKFPDDYPSNDLKGQNATFKVKVNEIKEKIERSLDEDFFADLALEGVKAEASLRKNVEESLKGSKEVEAENKFVDALLEEIEKTTEVDIPEELVEHELHHMVEQFNEQLRMQGMDIKYYHEVTKTNEEKLKEQMKPEALKRIKYRFILEEIKSLENITVTDEEAEKEADTTAKSYGMKKEDFLKAIGGLESMKYEVEIKKVIEFLKENNK